MEISEQKKTQLRIMAKLAQLGHDVGVCDPITIGPLITTYRFIPKSATKVAQICNCAEDIALALGVEAALIRRLPGEGVIGISVPNATRTSVLWRDTLARPDAAMLLPLNLGVDAEGQLYRDDLTKMPHLLIAGSTGGGKSVLTNSIIASLMYWQTPEQVRFALSDTKSAGGLEFNHFRGAPHLFCEPVNTKYTTWELMDALAQEADKRLTRIGREGMQNIAQWNKACKIHDEEGRVVLDTRLQMPYVIFIIDELADIMLSEARGEQNIANLKLGSIVQKSRAAGIHVIASTQRPSVDVVAGVVKNNFPSRLAFKLSSGVDSRTVLSEQGAENLLSQGDMLYNGPGTRGVATRLHSSFASSDDIRQMIRVAALRAQAPYLTA